MQNAPRMSRSTKAYLFFLVAALGGSVALNCLLLTKAVIFFRGASRTQLDPLGLDAHPRGPQPIDRGKGPLVVFFGDSRAAAWPAPRDVRGVQFINRGIGGETTAQALGRFPQHVAPLRADRIVVQLGINDLKAIPILSERKDAIIRHCKDHLRSIVDLSLETGAQVTITTIFPTARAPWERRPFWSGEVAVAVQDVNAFIHSLKSDRVTVFDAYRILVAADGNIDPAFSVDLLHVNANGYSALNRELAGMLP